MTQNTNGRNRRADRYQEKPADITPAAPKKTAQPRQAIGRSAELQARQAQMWQNSGDTHAPSRRPVRIYSDFDEAVISGKRPVSSRKKKKRRKQSHALIWTVVTLICLMCSGALAYAMAPQLLNMELGEAASFAFVNGSVIVRDQRQIDNFNSAVATLQTDLIHNGVYIDGVHVGGMTMQEAVDAVNRVPGGTGSKDFSIQVQVEDNRWFITSQDVPLYRNTVEVVQKAYAIGRSNDTAIRGSATTPFRQRLSDVQAVQTEGGAVYFSTETTYDHAQVRAIIEQQAEEYNVAGLPIDADVQSFDPNTKRFTFTDEKHGAQISADQIYQEVTVLLDSGVYYGTVNVTPTVLYAQVTRAELASSFGRISTYTTTKTGNSNRTTNIALSAEALNGDMIMPGETYSFNRATGERTEAKGYKPASAIAGGETFDEIGGGVCQTSSTLFNAVVRADLEITDRDPHAWPSNYVPKGEDAAVNWPDLDFKFKNSTDWPIWIVAWCDKSNKTVTVEIYGKTLEAGQSIDLYSEVVYVKEPPAETKYVYDPTLAYGTEKQTVKPRTGYKVETWKVYLQNGQEVGRVKLHTSNYPVYQTTVKHNKPDRYGME